MSGGPMSGAPPPTRAAGGTSQALEALGEARLPADARMRGYGVTAKWRRIAAARSRSPSVFTLSVTASAVTRPQARRT